LEVWSSQLIRVIRGRSGCRTTSTSPQRQSCSALSAASC